MKKNYKIFACAALFFAGSIISQKARAQSLSLNLSGTGDQITVPSYSMDLTPGNAVTIQYDIKFNTLADCALINATTGNAANPLDCYFLNGTQTITLGRGHVGTSNVVNTMFTPVVGQWYNFAVVLKQDTTALYIDGVLRISLVTTNPVYNTTFTANTLLIGMRDDGFGDADAQFDNVRIWTAEKTQTEIDSLRKVCIDGSGANLSLLYTFDDAASGGFITDLALNDGAQDGTIVGGITFDVGRLGATQGGMLLPLICSDGSYTAPSGAIYTTTGIYKDTIANVAGCDSIITISLAVNQAVAQKAVNQNSYTFCDSGVVHPTVVAADYGVNYTLLDNSFNTIQGPIAGTGGNLVFDSIAETQNTSYHFKAEKQYNDSAFYANGATYGQTTNPMLLTQDFTFEAWVKGASPNPAWTGIVATSVASGTGYSAQLAFDVSGTLQASVDGGGSPYSISGNTVVEDGTWHFIALTNDQDSLKIYVDGNLDAFFVQPSPVSFTMDRKINIGTLAQEGQGLINLNIDNLAIWEETRTQAEIAADMNITFLTGSEINLNAFYNFNINNMPLQFADATGNSYASLNNFPDIVEGVRTGVSFCSLLMTDTIAVTINTVDITTTNNSPTLTANATGAVYQWIDCGNGNAAISGETNASYTATANGSYAVIVTQNGCSDTSACMTVGNVGIQTYALNNFSVYPNPSKGNITIALGKTYKQATIQVVNVLGKVIASKIVSNEQTIQLNLDASKGVYFVKINTSEGQQSTTKLVVE